MSLKWLIRGGAGFLLLSVPGVLDFTEFTLNGGRENLSVEADAVPVVGTVELTAAGA